MRVGILGSGLMGGKLGTLFARVGHEVVFSYAREVLFDMFAARRRPKRPSLVYCGDDRGAKEAAAELLRDVGFDPLDVGPLRIARYTEPFTLLIARLAYEGDRGPAMAYRFEWMGSD